MSDISTERAEVTDARKDWQKIRDVLKGERAIKTAGTTYLPQPNPTDESDNNTARYIQYTDRAVFFNATKRTLNGLIGIAFRRWPEISVPSQLDGILDDIDSSGGAIINQLRRAIEENLSIGRFGLLADFPRRNTATSVAEKNEQNIHAYVVMYRAEHIINWRVDERGKLVMVVLYETVEQQDGYEISQVEQYRELSLDAGIYVVRLWQKSSDNGQWKVVDEFTPSDGTSKPWNEIPFTFCGAMDNNPSIDDSPLLDLACINIAHYRNSADYEESVYFNGQPTIAISGLTNSWWDEVLQQTLTIGSRGGIPLPAGGNITLVQAAPNTLARTAMDQKETQMVALGARLLTPGEVAKTAEQSRSETAAAHSVLSLCCDNVSDAYTRALKWLARYENTDDTGIELSIPTDFTGLIADPQLIQAIVAAWQAGTLPKSDMWSSFRQIGIVDAAKDDDQLQEEIDQEGGGLDLNIPQTDIAGVTGASDSSRQL
jgi:hypothetical protein